MAMLAGSNLNRVQLSHLISRFGSVVTKSNVILHHDYATRTSFGNIKRVTRSPVRHLGTITLQHDVLLQDAFR